MTWQPIETCPDDGRPILIFDHRNHKDQRIELRPADGGFWRWNIANGTDMPRYWMPLPLPPTEKDGER